MRTKLIRVALLLGVMGLLPMPAPGGEGGDPEPGAEAPPPPPRREGENRRGGADREKMREIFRKMRAGEKLTAEEQAIADRMRNRMGGRDRGGRAQEAELRLVNVVDAVKLTLAMAHVGKQKPEEAVKVLDEVVAKSADKTAVGFAHLYLARIYKAKGDEEKVKAELAKVTGPAIVGALQMMLAGEPSAEKLEALLKDMQDPLGRAVLIRTLAAIYAREGNVEKLADLAVRAAKLVTAEQASEALELEARMAGLRGMDPRGGDPRAGRDRGREFVEQRRAQTEARIKELEAAGKKEEAEELRQRMKRMEEMMQRFRRGGRRGRGDREEQAPAPAPGGEEDLF